MLLAEPPRTAYDLHFQVLGFPVRVTPFFWVVAALLGYDLARSLRGVGPGQFALLLMWVAAVFLSLLIHELGHAVAMRYYGRYASVVLYHFGGLAIADSGSSFLASSRRGKMENQIVISLAGPAAQLLLAALILVGLRAGDFDSIVYRIWPLDELFPEVPERQLPSRTLDIMLYFLCWPSIAWALFNLLPIFPLDGGQVSRELFTAFSGYEGFRQSLYLSLAVAVGMAIWCFSNDNSYTALLCISLAVSNYQLLEAMRYGGWR